MSNFNNASKLITNHSELTNLLSFARNKFNIPAISVSLINKEKIVANKIIGLRVYGQLNNATLDDYFHIGSCSKSVLALIAERLVEEQKITWETKFFDLYPELKNKAKFEYFDITLENLFMCEAGILPYTSGEERFPEVNFNLQNPRLAFIEYLIKQPPVSKPINGKFRHLYSNASYTVASSMLEKVSDFSYENLVMKTFNDLRIPCHIGWPNNYNENQPWGHQVKNKKIEKFPPNHEYRLPYLLTPAGDLSLTPTGFAKYTQLHLQGLSGQKNYVSSEGYKNIHFRNKGFSLGVVNGYINKKPFSGFDGSAGTFFARSIIMPNDDFAFTILMNAGSGTGSMKSVDWLTLQIIKKHFNWWWKLWL